MATLRTRHRRNDRVISFLAMLGCSVRLVRQRGGFATMVEAVDGHAATVGERLLTSSLDVDALHRRRELRRAAQ